MSILAREVLSPSRSTYRDSAAEALRRALERRGRPVNAAAGGYVVDLARALGLATERLVATARSQALSLVGGDHGTEHFDPSLTEGEGLALLAAFLAADAPALSMLADRIRAGPVTSSQLTEEHIIDSIFRRVLGFYLDRARDVRDRVAIRAELERQQANYVGKTPKHKLDVRLALMQRTGIVERHGDEWRRGGDSLDRLANLTRDPKALEDLEDQLMAGDELMLAAQVLHGDRLGVVSVEPTITTLQAGYGKLIGTSKEFAEIDALADFLCITRVVERREFLPRDLVRQLVMRLASKHPSSVRIHVDREGRPAFVALSADVSANGA